MALNCNSNFHTLKKRTGNNFGITRSGSNYDKQIRWMGWCPEEELMMTHSHLTSLDRSLIQQRLNEEESFRSIGRELGKDPTTIAKEVKIHIQFRQSGCYGTAYNNCFHRSHCPAQHPIVPPIRPRPAPSSPNHFTCATAVTQGNAAPWRNGYMWRRMHRRSMRKPAQKPDRASRSTKWRR